MDSLIDFEKMIKAGEYVPYKVIASHKYIPVDIITTSRRDITIHTFR